MTYFTENDVNETPKIIEILLKLRVFMSKNGSSIHCHWSPSVVVSFIDGLTYTEVSLVK